MSEGGREVRGRERDIGEEREERYQGKDKG